MCVDTENHGSVTVYKLIVCILNLAQAYLRIISLPYCLVERSLVLSEQLLRRFSFPQVGERHCQCSSESSALILIQDNN